MERVHKSPELPKTIVKLESSADHDLGNIQNVTLSMHLQNTLLLCGKDNSFGHSGNICTDDWFFHEEVLFIKELDNKQKTIDNLSNIINHMHRNSNEPSNNFYKNRNDQPVQINATAGERFQTQNRNNLTVKNNTYEDITLNQTHSKGIRNEETQQYRDINKHINKYDREPTY